MAGSQTHTQFSTIRGYDAPSWLLTVIGVLLGAISIAYVYVHPEPVGVWAFEFVLVSVPAAGIVYGGYWIATHSLSRSDRWSIVIWSLIGGSVAGALIAGYIAAEQIAGGTVIEPGELLLIGVLGGTVISLYASISNERHHLAAEFGSIDERQLLGAAREPFSEEAQALAELALDGRSWNVVHLLLLAENPLGVETLADRIAAVEDGNQETVYVDLIHGRIPKLEQQGLVHYESDTGIVRPADRVTAVVSAGDEIAASGHRLASVRDQ